MHSRPPLIAALSSATVLRSVSRPCRKRLQQGRGGSEGEGWTECGTRHGARRRTGRLVSWTASATLTGWRRARFAAPAAAPRLAVAAASPVAPEHLFPSVARQLEEGVGGKDDRAVGQRGVGDHKVLQHRPSAGRDQRSGQGMAGQGGLQAGRQTRGGRWTVQWVQQRQKRGALPVGAPINPRAVPGAANT